MTTIGVVFGGRSVEHEVSVLTALQVMAALPDDRVRSLPVYITKDGRWFSGEALQELDAYRDVDRLLARCRQVWLPPVPGAGLVTAEPRRGLLGGQSRALDRVDVWMPLVHGSHGEDGTLQGLFELCDVAYTGCGVTAAALSMDKRAAKLMFRGAGLPVLDDVLLTRERWDGDAPGLVAEVRSALGFPVFVKPLAVGSSIGVARAANEDELRDAVDAALAYDTRCLAEAAQDGIVEVNCAVLGRGDAVRISVCEQPVASGLLSYADKYPSKGGGAKALQSQGMKAAQRIIPAPLDEALTQRLRDAAATAFRAIGAEGVARVDFLVHPDEGRYLVNEINTVPGSLAFYLWEPAGLGFGELLSELVELALQRHAQTSRTQYSIDSWLLSGRPQR